MADDAHKLSPVQGKVYVVQGLVLKGGSDGVYISQVFHL